MLTAENGQPESMFLLHKKWFT